MILRTAGSVIAPGGARGKLLILCYHRVLDGPDPLIPDGLSRDAFDMHMRMVGRAFTPLPLSDAMRRLQAGTLPPRAVSITFDDGYADNHDIALPILRRHRVPATIFVATGFLDGGRMWNDTIVEAMRRIRGTDFDASEFGLGRLSLATPAERGQAALALMLKLRRLPPPERAAHVARLAERIGADLPDDLMLSSDQVRALHAGGIEIGAHTVSHPILARLEPEVASAEITESRAHLADIIGGAIDGFAYPNGKPGIDFDDIHAETVRRAGFRYAVTTASGYARAGTDPFRLPRVLPWGSSRLSVAKQMLRGFTHNPSPALAHAG